MAIWAGYEANRPMAEAFEAIQQNMGLSDREFAEELSTKAARVSAHQIFRWRKGTVVLPAWVLKRAAEVSKQSMDYVLKHAPAMIKSHATSDTRMKALEAQVRDLSAQLQSMGDRQAEMDKLRPALQLIVEMLGKARNGAER